MSFDATRQVWSMRRARRLPGGTTLLVLLALADRADRHTGEVSASARYLAQEVGVHHSQAARAVATGHAEGAIEVVNPGRGTRATVYRFTTVARPDDDANGLSTARPQSNANGSLASHLARPLNDASRPLNDASASPQRQIPDQSLSSNHQGAASPVQNPAAAALALMVVVEMRIEELRGAPRRPAALRASIERRLAGAFSARLAGMVAEGMSPAEAATVGLAEDGVLGPCPTCGATDAEPTALATRCARATRCPYFVGELVSAEVTW
jgi:hypothetical protein